ncbi:MAG: restriction endonuclease subunit S [Saprospiraceae bacterium]|nr:restriction endonuclease subunit S [Saprospiraceae bacterium]
MSKNNENKLVPRLRFPEFHNDGNWEEKSLGAVAENIMYGMNSAAVEFDGENKYIRITDIDEETRMFIPNPLTSPEGLLEEKYAVNIGDLLFARTGASVGKSYLHKKESGKVYFAGFLIRFTIKDAVPYFIYAQTHTNKYQKWVLATSARSGQPGINAEEYKSYPIQIPINYKEQQKIAACLSSLDEVITAESQKLEVLKDHKKGLLQNLLPQEGETVPKFRFKEFEKDGEWEVTKLSELGYLINGLTYSPEDVRDKGLLVLRSSNIQDGLIDLKDCVYVREDINGANLTKPKDIIVCVRNGSKSLIGKNAVIPEGIPFATHGAFMTAFRANNPAFVFQLFQSDYYGKQVRSDLGATINSINGKNFIKYEFPVPKNPKEQEKIADTLSSVDDLIKAQTEKVLALQLHKKGLLQGLFPNINEVTE